MKDYKEYFKSKAKLIKGSATLKPPAGGQDGLQSVASMNVLDLISEGPIYGLVDAEGRKTNNMSILNSLYLDNTRVLDKGIPEPQIRTVDFDQIQMMGRLTSANIETAFDNISGQLVAYESATNFNVNNAPMSSIKKRDMAEDKQALIEFVNENKSLSRFGMIQFKSYGIFPTGDTIYSRVNNTTNRFENTAPVDPSTVTNFTIEWSDGTNTYTGTATIAIQAGTTATALRSLGSLKWNVLGSDGQTYVMFKQEASDGRFFWHFGGLYSYGNNSTNGNDTSLAINGATSTSEDFPWVDRTASTWYQYQATASPTQWNQWTLRFTSFNSQATEIYNTTTFNLDVYNGTNLAKRLIKNEDGEAIEIPSPIFYGYQVFNNSKFGTYTAAPNALDVGVSGKVGKKYLIDGFAGGGIYFFEIGDNDELKANGDFNTGKFFVAKGGNVPNTLQSGLDNGYDVFVYDGATGPISLESPTPNQLSPIVGELAGQEIGLGYISDLNLTYNYGNIDFDFREGFERQPKMLGHSEGDQDFDIRKKLYGPLQYGGSARDGDGEGYSDPRQGGDFSTWMLNPPLESDSYPYTHTIKRIDVKKATPTLAIEGLSDTIANGSSAGVQQSETLLMGFTYGFEGGVTGNVGTLLAAGNNLKDIALGTFEVVETNRYEGIVVSNYLDTYDEIGDLPRNKVLRGVTVDDTNIPGLTQAMINQYGYTSGELIFPGEDWKVPNRFIKIEKLSYETDSTLITRDCSLSYVSERIGEPFSYPLVATAGTIFDARNFAAQPTRDFEVRGKLIAIPSNYEPLDSDGSDKRFISSSKDYGLRSIQTYNGSSNYAQVYDHIDLGTSNFEIEARVGFGSVFTTTANYQYIVDMEGGTLQENRIAIYQTDDQILAIVKESTSTDTDFILGTSIAGRNSSHFYNDWEWINDAQNLTFDANDANIDTSTSFNIQFDLLLGNVGSASPGNSILWTAGSHQRVEIRFTSGNRIQLTLGRLPVGSTDGNGVENTTTEVPAKSATSTRTFSKFEFVQFKLEGNLSTGIKLRDRSDNSIIAEITTADLADVRAHPNGMARITVLYILGVNSQNATIGRAGAGAMRNLSVQGVSIFTDTYNTAGVSKRFNSDPNFLKVSDVNLADVYDISLKAVGRKYTLEVKVGDELLPTNFRSNTMSTPRGNINFGGPNINQGADSAPFLLMGISAIGNSRLTAGTKLSDVRIKKNNQLIHHWDGTVINVVRHDNCMKDKVGGFHADLTGPVNTVLDSNFTFGKNKKRIYNGPWDGTFRLGWTDNPAWILYDLMINPIYGVGNSIDDREDINIFNLYKIAQYCDAVDSDGYFDGLPDATRGLEPRFSCNIRIYDPKNAFEVVGNIASIFRGFTYWDGVGLNFAIDNEKQISAIFNNGNVFDGIFNYGDITSSARFSKVEVMYSDSNDLYSTKSEYIEDEDAIRKYGIVSKILNGIGCTSKSQAKRMGKYVLLSNKMETEIVSFKASSECFFLEPGDIIRIDDEVKNFEINYGKVLEVNSLTPDPYIRVESHVNPSKIRLGSAGGVYLYTNRKQNELENIYDIVKYRTLYQFGEDSHTYSGVVNTDFINQQSLTEIQKIQVTGAVKEDNNVKLYLDTGDANFQHLSGAQVGSFFNVELTNDVDKTYKVIRKRQQENNIFNIEAIQYDIEKFKKIEEEDFDVEEVTYNIGIPAHTINRPLTPTFDETVILNNDLSYSVTGTIDAQPNSNETSYRVVAYRSNQAGPYVQKEFLRESDDTTEYRLNGLIDGNYTISVAALRNPESSNNFTKNFSIESRRDIYMNPIIKEIEIGNSNISNYERISGSGFGSGSSNYKDVEYRFVTVDKKDRTFSLTQLDYTLDVFIEKSGEYAVIAQDHEADTFTFTDVDNMIFFGDYNYDFNAKFDLKKDGTVVDSAFFETNVINLN